MNLRHRVKLTVGERLELQGLIRGGKQPVRKLMRAQILLAADEGRSDEEIAGSVAVSLCRVYRTRPRFVDGKSALGAQ